MKMIIASTSTLHGSGYLEYLKPELSEFFQGVSEIVFVPFARPSGITHDEYTAIAAKYFAGLGIVVKGLHEFNDMKKAIQEAEAVFTGGGNTFLLLDQLYQFDLVEDIREAVKRGALYLGTSAGSNITGQTVKNTNDMPIIYPSSFEALGLLPFNINPHYLDPVPGSKHMGETRETRIKEYLVHNDVPVIGLREGSYLFIKGEEIELRGELSARWFEPGKDPVELPSGTKTDFITGFSSTVK